jgi:hypothetical protein
MERLWKFTVWLSKGHQASLSEMGLLNAPGEVPVSIISSETTKTQV